MLQPVFIRFCTLQPVTKRYLSYNNRITNTTISNHIFYIKLFLFKAAKNAPLPEEDDDL